jgi:hypothetical protein
MTAVILLTEDLSAIILYLFLLNTKSYRILHSFRYYRRQSGGTQCIRIHSGRLNTSPGEIKDELLSAGIINAGILFLQVSETLK